MCAVKQTVGGKVNDPVLAKLFARRGGAAGVEIDGFQSFSRGSGGLDRGGLSSGKWKPCDAASLSRNAHFLDRPFEVSRHGVSITLTRSSGPGCIDPRIKAAEDRIREHGDRLWGWLPIRQFATHHPKRRSRGQA